MRQRYVARRAAVLLIALAGPAAADQWDVGTDADNGNGTDNTPLHGSEQVHDLAAAGALPDEDWYKVPTHAWSSYQFVVEGTTGGLDLTTADVQLVGVDGSVFTSAIAMDGVLSLRWMGEILGPLVRFVRVSGAGCGTACTESDRYTARFYETTATIPRFNDSGTQSTVLLLQNATARICTLRIGFLDTDGEPFAPPNVVLLLAHELLVLPTGLAGRSGSVRIAHTCGYGGLSGKAVSIEPATGFTFDTPLLYKPR